ncbi:MAG: hypothetical protein QME27_04025 [Syntrophaceae bacterium]|nr:hypothetical protein [Syntrophaceae bacterium]
MSFEILHFRGSDEILRQKNMGKEIYLVMEYLDDVLYGSLYRRELLRQALDEMDWRNDGDLNILEGRRYAYKGLRKRVAMDGNFSSYEYIQDALLRLQIGFDKKRIDIGIVLVTAERSEKSHLGTTKDLLCQEIEMLYPTISLPVTVALFDLGKRTILADEDELAAPREPVFRDERNDIDEGAVAAAGNVSSDGEPPLEIERGRKKKGAKKKNRPVLSPEEPAGSPIAVNQ